MALCIASGALTVALAVEAFTLSWVHSVEKNLWEEDWRVEARALHLVAARIRGTGAGMEMPADARLQDGVWHYRPAVAPMAAIRLTHSPFTSGYTLCTGDVCRLLTDFLPGIADTAVIVVSACHTPAT